MALTKEDIQTIKRIVNRNTQENMKVINRYILGKSYIMNITYDQLAKEVVEINQNVPDIPIVVLE